MSTIKVWRVCVVDRLDSRASRYYICGGEGSAAGALKRLSMERESDRGVNASNHYYR